MYTLYQKELAPLVKIYKDIDRRGILVDTAKRDELISKYLMYFEANLKVLRGFTGDDKFNPNSPAQVGALVYEILKYPKRSKISDTGRHGYKTDKDTLDDLIINSPEKCNNPRLGPQILARIITCRKLGKVLEYLSTPLHPDGRFRCSYNLAGTETGRTSASKTIDECILTIKDGTTRLGRSFQTLTKHGFHVDEDIFDDIESATIAHDIRSIFIPSDGYVFMEMDGSQAEARVVAVLAEDWILLDTFDLPPKLHARTAAQIFDDITAEEITKNLPVIPGLGIAYYDMGKRVRHAGNYDMGPFRLAQMTHLGLGSCEIKMQRFHAANSNTREVFHREIREALHLPRRELVTPLGRRRRFFERLSEKVYKKGFAQIPQSTISDHTKFTMRRVLEDFDEVRFLAEMHDGLMAEVPKDQIEEVSKSFRKHYERIIDFSGCTLSRDYKLVIPCEIEYSSTSWMEMKELD